MTSSATNAPLTVSHEELANKRQLLDAGTKRNSLLTQNNNF